MGWFKGQQPFCRNCGKPIKKKTHSIFFGQSARSDEFSTCRPEKPKSKDEVKRLVNEQVISVSWFRHGSDPYIVGANTWDGETYVDDLFCTVRCGEAFGRVCASQQNLAMPAYHAAIAQKETP
ncbi:hypothetical protein BAJUN_00600 [Bajunvirus bajun]|uniref:Uncharacterized protein n=1 Tax=Brevundimonas phage vB_BgoS-Bajun TaxID=2948594 RepID=A0A9E7SU18_9CAUD|nr:hypothetical protein BAJUN_00600 [Brevundimonas phage vB_BgoS-Bajun]